MAQDPFHIIIPAAPFAQELFARHQVTQAFYREVQYRTAVETQGAWYEAVALQNQRDLKQMRREPNLLHFLNRQIPL